MSMISEDGFPPYMPLANQCLTAAWCGAQSLACTDGCASCAAEMMVKAYMTSYKLPCIITRGNNVYGPHQFPEKLVPKFTLLARRGEALPVHGAGQVSMPAPPRIP